MSIKEVNFQPMAQTTRVQSFKGNQNATNVTNELKADTFEVSDKKPMSTKKKVAIGLGIAGAVAATVGIIYAAKTGKLNGIKDKVTKFFKKNNTAEIQNSLVDKEKTSKEAWKNIELFNKADKIKNGSKELSARDKETIDKLWTKYHDMATTSQEMKYTLGATSREQLIKQYDAQVLEKKVSGATEALKKVRDDLAIAREVDAPEIISKLETKEKAIMKNLNKLAE